MFKSYGEPYFCFSMQLTQLDSEVLTCLPSAVVVPMSVQFSNILQCNSDLSWLCATQWPILDLDNSLSQTLVLKCIVYYLASDLCMHSSGVRPGITGLLSWIHSLSAISLIPSSPMKLHILVLWPKTWGFSYPTLLWTSHDCMHLGPSGRKMEGKKISGGLLHCLDCWKQTLQHYLIWFQLYNKCNTRWKLQVLGVHKPSLPPLPLKLPLGLPGGGVQEKRVQR